MRSTRNLMDLLQPNDAGRAMHALIGDLYPICRSITGNGVRTTLKVIGSRIPLSIREVPTGTEVFDWTVPREWNVRDAYIKDPVGNRVLDFRRCNLHVVSYSRPVKAMVDIGELKKHLFTIPEHPDWVPYRTSYYNENWGFCLSQRQFEQLTESKYEVCIDASLEPGHLSYGECHIEGSCSDEVLISTHCCHPSLCNDNLSGIAVAVFLADYLRSRASLRYSYRVIFIPGTIGSITWLALNESRTSRIKHGLTLACLGDQGKSTYKKSRIGDAEIDRVAIHVLEHSGSEHEIQEFSPYGYDERQYCSPGFNLPVGCLMRTPHGRYPEYHTSADNLDLVKPSALADSLSKCVEIVEVLEKNRAYVNQNPKCEPRLGRHGLYRSIGGVEGRPEDLALFWVLNLSDGQHTLLEIAERSNLSFKLIFSAAEQLLAHELLKEERTE